MALFEVWNFKNCFYLERLEILWAWVESGILLSSSHGLACLVMWMQTKEAGTSSATTTGG
jgi:hypothetical protein